MANEYFNKLSEKIDNTGLHPLLDFISRDLEYSYLGRFNDYEIDSIKNELVNKTITFFEQKKMGSFGTIVNCLIIYLISEVRSEKHKHAKDELIITIAKPKLWLFLLR